MHHVPKYRLHKARNVAVVTLHGKDHYLGENDNTESWQNYHRLLLEQLQQPVNPPIIPAVNIYSNGPATFTINELILQYWEFATKYYRKYGEPTTELDCLRHALGFLRRTHGDTIATQFGPKALKEVREAMLTHPILRRRRNPKTDEVHRVLIAKGLTRKVKLWNELRGDPVSRVQTERQRYKILTRGGSIGTATGKPERAWAFVVKNLERLIEELHRHQLKTGRVEFHLEQRSYDYQMYHFGAGSNLEAPTDRFDTLIEVYQQLFRRTYQRHLLVSRMHLLAHRLESAALAQRGLFDPPAEPERTLAMTKRQINTDVSRFALRSGATLPIKDWYDDPALGEEAIAPQRTVW